MQRKLHTQYKRSSRYALKYLICLLYSNPTVICDLFLKKMNMAAHLCCNKSHITTFEHSQDNLIYEVSLISMLTTSQRKTQT